MSVPGDCERLPALDSIHDLFGPITQIALCDLGLCRQPKFLTRRPLLPATIAGIAVAAPVASLLVFGAGSAPAAVAVTARYGPIGTTANSGPNRALFRAEYRGRPDSHFRDERVRARGVQPGERRGLRGRRGGTDRQEKCGEGESGRSAHERLSLPERPRSAGS
jgi:hypothetical protein